MSDSATPVDGSRDFVSDWVSQAGGSGQIRLISAPLSGANYTAAVEIRLAPSAITYWRQPGDAGVPPEFSFAGSDNVARADVLYPAPRRLDEAGLEAIGYQGGVTFPIRVTPADPAKSVRLALTLAYAICDRICLPAKGHVELALPRSGASPQAAAIAAAEAKVPAALPAADIARSVVIQHENGRTKPQWRVEWRGDAAADLFAEGPQGFAFETHKTGPNVFTLVAVATSDTPASQVPLRLTLTAAGKSYEWTVPIAIAAPGH